MEEKPNEMTETLQHQIDITRTYVCANCDTKVKAVKPIKQDGQKQYAVCPHCGGLAEKPRLSARETSVSAYVFHYLPQYLIQRVKLPLIKMIILAANSLDIELDEKNTRKLNTHTILKIRDRFMQYSDNPCRDELWRSAFKLWAFENEHDPDYDWRSGFIMEMVIEAIFNGEWQARQEGKPDRFWKEPQPHGWQHSIIYKLQKHREQILKILETEEV